MQPHIWIWVWLVFAVIMAVGEWLEGGGFLLPFAVGASAAALMEWLWPGSSTGQWIAFLSITSVLTIVIRRRADLPATLDRAGAIEDVPAADPETAENGDA